MERHSQAVLEAVVLDTGGVQRHTVTELEAVVMPYDGEQVISQTAVEAVVMGFGFARLTHAYASYAMQQMSSVQVTHDWVSYALQQLAAVRVTHEYVLYAMHQESAVRVTHLYVQVALKPSGRPDHLPILLGICNMRNVIRAGEEESGVAASPGTWQAVAQEVFTYRRQLLQRLRFRYFDAEDGQQELVVPAGETEDQVAVPYTPMLSVERIEAKRTGTDDWEEVRPVEASDRAGDTRPAFLLRDTELLLLNYTTEWDGIFEAVRLRGVPNPIDDEDWDDDTLVPNELLGPLFCTCLKLEAARILCLREPTSGMLRSQYILAERQQVEKHLFNQGASMNRHLSSRGTPFPHRPEQI